jgi:hypothetical protein
VTPEAFALLVASCGIALPPGVTVDRITAYAMTESGLNPNAVSPPNRNGTRDYGAMQINQIHFARFGVNERTVKEPCTNIRIGATIIAENDARSACLYNTGRPHCSNGYDSRIARAAVRLAAGKPDAPPASEPPPPPKPPEEPACAPTFDSWALALCQERQQRAKRLQQTQQPQPEPKEDQ